MITVIKANWLDRKKIAKEMKLDGYVSMVEISGRNMTYEIRGEIFNVPTTPKKVKDLFEKSTSLRAICLDYGGPTKKYWYNIQDLYDACKRFAV